MTSNDGAGPLASAQRNSSEGKSLLEGIDWGAGVNPPHPGEVLFDTGENIEELLKKSDVPEKMVPVISKMLWKAKRYSIDTLEDLVRWYLLTRLAKDREARREYMEVVMAVKKSADEEDLVS